MSRHNRERKENNRARSAQGDAPKFPGQIPPGRPPGGHTPPSGDGPIPQPSHEDLQRLVIDFEDVLNSKWTGRREPGDILVLGDLRRKEIAEAAEANLGPERVREARIDADRRGRAPMIAYLQPLSFIDMLRGSGDFAHREAAKELRVFSDRRELGIVPLPVVRSGGLWATCWSPPDSNVSVVRYRPEATPMSN